METEALEAVLDYEEESQTLSLLQSLKKSWAWRMSQVHIPGLHYPLSFCLTRERNDFQLFPIRFWCYVKQSLFQTDTFLKICKHSPPPTTTETKNLNLFPFIVEPAFPPATFLTFLNPDDTALLHLSYAVHRHSPWEIIFNNIVESNFPASDFG